MTRLKRGCEPDILRRRGLRLTTFMWFQIRGRPFRLTDTMRSDPSYLVMCQHLDECKAEAFFDVMLFMPISTNDPIPGSRHFHSICETFDYNTFVDLWS